MNTYKRNRAQADWANGWAAVLPEEHPPMVPEKVMAAAASAASAGKARAIVRLSGFRAATDLVRNRLSVQEGRSMAQRAKEKALAAEKAARQAAKQEVTDSEDILFTVCIYRAIATRPAQQNALDTVEARVRGESIAEIAKRLDVDRAMVDKWSQRGLAIIRPWVGAEVIARSCARWRSAASAAAQRRARGE